MGRAIKDCAVRNAFRPWARGRLRTGLAKRVVVMGANLTRDGSETDAQDCTVISSIWLPRYRNVARLGPVSACSEFMGRDGIHPEKMPGKCMALLSTEGKGQRVAYNTIKGKPDLGALSAESVKSLLNGHHLGGARGKTAAEIVVI